MPQIHILTSTQGPRSNIFNGLYGSVQKDPSDDSKFVFKIDPELAKCSRVLSGQVQNGGLVITADDFTTIEADGPVLDALKAGLVRGIQKVWEAYYESILGPLDSQIRNEDDTPIQLGQNGTMAPAILHQALISERAMTREGVQGVIDSLNQVKPFWVDVSAKGVLVVPNFLGDEQKIGDIAELSMPEAELRTVPIESWGDAVHPTYSTTGVIAPDADGVISTLSGRYDATAALPVYLPVVGQTPALEAPTAVPASRAFSFSASTAVVPVASAEIPQETVAAATSEELVEKTMRLILETPVLRALILKQGQGAQVDFTTCQPSVGNYEYAYDEGDEEDDEDDEDGDDDDHDDVHRTRNSDRG